MNEEEFQRDIEQPARRSLDHHFRFLAGVTGVASLTQIASSPGDKEEKCKAMTAACKRAHDAFDVETPWEAMPDSVRAYSEEVEGP